MQIRFHAPSEHFVNGVQYDAEMHIVHHYKGTDSHLGAMIAIFFDTKRATNNNPAFLDSVFKVLDMEGPNAAGQIRIEDFLKKIDFRDYWSYEGSLTTPPCEEGIKWIVLSNVQYISPAHLTRITAKLADDPEYASGRGNNRALQARNGREIFHTLATTRFLIDFLTLGAFLSLLFY